MIFDEIPADAAEGAILAHSVREGDDVALKKGKVLTAADVEALLQAGIRHVTAARLEPGDVHEDEAAMTLAKAVAGTELAIGNAFTGRVNIFAQEAGLFVVDKDRVDRINQLNESITIATLPAYEPVEPSQMVATVKIIPFAAAAPDLSRAEDLSRASGDPPVLQVAPYRHCRISLIQTRLNGTSAKMLDKTETVTRRRVEEIGSTLTLEGRCDHTAEALATEIASQIRKGIDILLIAGASAITDRRDVLPAGIELANGVVEHFGMPVDPGNLILLGRVSGIPVLGLPGCARSPKLNGFDWILRRLAAGTNVTGSDIMGMGVGGLLTEIPSRPQPRGEPTRSKAPERPVVDAIILAGGRSSRMGANNKLLSPVGDKPMLVSVVDAALAAHLRHVIVVLGHDAEPVVSALGDRKVATVRNPHYQEGISTSIQAGVAALDGTQDAVIIAQGDMPGLTPDIFNGLIGAYDPAAGQTIVVPTRHGKRGNPVLWDKRFLPAFRELAGDVGAKPLIGRNEESVREVDLGTDAVLVDIDTPEALSRYLGEASTPAASATRPVRVRTSSFDSSG